MVVDRLRIVRGDVGGEAVKGESGSCIDVCRDMMDVVSIDGSVY